MICENHFRLSEENKFVPQLTGRRRPETSNQWHRFSLIGSCPADFVGCLLFRLFFILYSCFEKQETICKVELNDHLCFCYCRSPNGEIQSPVSTNRRHKAILVACVGRENINTPYYLMACARIDVEKPRNIQPRQHTTNTHYQGKVPANTIKRRHSIFASESALMAWDLNLGRATLLVTSEKHRLQPHLFFFFILRTPTSAVESSL